MAIKSSYSSRSKGGFPYPILALVLLGALAASQPASATTYTFTIPVGTQSNPNPNTLLWALNGVLSVDGFGDSISQFAFYDFYVRPQIALDGCVASGDNCTPTDLHGNNMNGGSNTGASGNTFNLISDYSSMAAATPPVPGCVSPIPNNCTSTYNATLNTPDPHAGGNSVRFRFNAGDNTVALVTGDPNAGNQTYSAGSNNPFPSGATTEIMTSSANLTFSFTTSSYSTFQTPQITFQIYALAIKYTTPNGINLSAKDQNYVTNLDLVGTAPEPSTIFVAGGGLCLLALARLRRKIKQ